MADEISVEVGDLYANVHDTFCDNPGETYEERLRLEVENFIHNFNQQLEREREKAMGQAVAPEKPEQTEE